MGIKPAVRGRHSLGVAYRRSVARPARRVSQRGDLLAASAAVGRRRCLAGGMAAVTGGAESPATAGVGRNLSGWQLRVGQKGALLSEKPSAGRGQSGWYWSMARAFLWERNWRALPRRKSH